VPRVKQRTEDLRERGLAGALAVLAEEGVAGLTTRAVAGRANASLPAIYEVFGDKAGIVREVFFHGFHLLAEDLSALPETPDPLAAVRQPAEALRRFIVGNPVLAEIMFARPFADFDPTAEETRAGVRVRKIFTRHVRAAVDADLLSGDPTDIALVLFVYAEGMAKAENAHRLGGARHSIDRRWRLGLNALLDGFSGASRSATD
jgi:AcrR family transcriptional regulator